MKKAGEEGLKLDRKSVERNRRLQMKTLCFKLFSLIPKDASAHSKSKQQDHLDLATEYIKEMEKRVEELKHKKQTGDAAVDDDHVYITSHTSSEKQDIQKLPIIEIREVNHSILEILLICGVDTRFVFYQLINVVQDEGAQVVNASSSIVGDNIFYTVHSKIKSPRIGLESSRVLERIKKLVQC